MHHDRALGPAAQESSGQSVRIRFLVGAAEVRGSCVLHNHSIRLLAKFPLSGQTDYGSSHIFPCLLHNVGHKSRPGAAQLQRSEDHEVDGLD